MRSPGRCRTSRRLRGPSDLKVVGLSGAHGYSRIRLLCTGCSATLDHRQNGLALSKNVFPPQGYTSRKIAGAPPPRSGQGSVAGAGPRTVGSGTPGAMGAARSGQIAGHCAPISDDLTVGKGRGASRSKWRQPRLVFCPISDELAVGKVREPSRRAEKAFRLPAGRRPVGGSVGLALLGWRDDLQPVSVRIAEVDAIGITRAPARPQPAARASP